MSHAEKCPVCKGKEKKPDCQGCNGKGWVTVSNIPVSQLDWTVIDRTSTLRPNIGSDIQFYC